MQQKNKVLGMILTLMFPASIAVFYVTKWWIIAQPKELQKELNILFLFLGLLLTVSLFMLPIGIFFLLKYVAEKKGTPKAWYARGWMILILFVITFAGYSLVSKPSPEIEQNIRAYRQKDQTYYQTVQARLDEIEKEVTGLAEKGVECFNGKVCSFMIIFHFNSLPSGYQTMLSDYTREFGTLKQEIYGSKKLSKIRVQAQVGGNVVYECESGEGGERNLEFNVSCKKL